MTASAQNPGLGGPAPSEAVDRRAVIRASSSVTGMTLFVASEAVFFAAFFGIYASSYTAARDWPPAGVASPSLLLPSIGVVVLLASAVTMTMALRVLRRPDYPHGLATWLVGTLVGSVAFAVLVAVSIVDVNMGIGDNIYATLFYSLIGLELAHAVGGVALLGLAGVRTWTGEIALRRDPVQAGAIYWYFVVGLGIAIYVVLYLGASL